MNTKTHLILTMTEALDLANDLSRAVSRIYSGEDIQHVMNMYEQASGDGPWRLTLTVPRPEGD